MPRSVSPEPRRRRSRSRSPVSRSRTSKNDRERDYGRDKEKERRGRQDKERQRSRSRSRSRDRRERSRSRDRDRRSSKPSTSKALAPRPRSRSRSRSASPSEEKNKPPPPNFAASGLLAAESNNFKGIVLKYNEPPEARKSLRNWRVYVFKDGKEVDMFQLNRQSAYLIGRDKIVCDIPAEHPSTSKQHAVIQFRQIWEKNPETGKDKGIVKPFVIDLESANGTMVNEEKIPTSRYYELRSGDGGLLIHL
ncbi:SMAD/FHA domain-containing protein [Atractiella rhizophila]|nr:SMAD/FHA domain-containing protein [Atractiella rhizophila]